MADLFLILNNGLQIGLDLIVPVGILVLIIEFVYVEIRNAIDLIRKV